MSMPALETFYGNILLFLILIPLFGICILLFVPNSQSRLLHQIALNTTLINFFLSIFL